MKEKRWIYRHHDQNIVEEISEKFKISPLIAGIIVNRNMTTSEEIQAYLKKDISSIHDPYLMKDMQKAVDRIREAINNQEKITIYGDYDVDGVTSTSIMVRYLTGCGANVDYYIPDRIDEGYGINKDALTKIKESGTTLIITVDSGITAVEEVQYATRLGLDVIITDHHECKEQVPVANAVINPKQKDCSYPFKDLAGVGVAFKLIQALEGIEHIEDLLDRYCDIVCLGTVADVVPLVGENRTIVYRGLQQMANTTSVGLNAILKVAGLDRKKITTGTVGFVIAPRINAAGRIGSALRAVELFLTDDELVAEQIAVELNEENKNRQATEASILSQAMQLMEKDYDMERQKVIVLAHEHWHHGVIGIVASRITDKFYRPSILISVDGDEGKGSGRSIEGFNLFEALMQCSQYLTKFGGHELAAGLSIPQKSIQQFRNEINRIADEKLHQEDLIPPVYIDFVVDTRHLTLEHIKQLDILEPFGMGNPAPVFAFCNVKILDIRSVGDDKHLKLSLKKDDVFVDAIGFNMGDYAKEFIQGDRVDIACSLEVNSYNGREKPQLIIKDIKITDEQAMSYNYYKTFFIDEKSGIIDNNKCVVQKANTLTLQKHIKAGEKCLILVNTLKGVYNIKSFIKMSLLDEKNCRYHYNEIIKSSQIDILINPKQNGFDAAQYDYVYLYDPCFSIKQFYEFVASRNNLYILFDLHQFEWCQQVLDGIIPERKHFVMVYQYVKSRCLDNHYNDDIDLFVRRIAISYNCPFNIRMLENVLEIFEELGLFKVMKKQNELNICLCKHKGAKINIEHSVKLSQIRKLKKQLEDFKQYISNLKN